MPLYLVDVLPYATVEYVADPTACQAVLCPQSFLRNAASSVACANESDIVGGNLDVCASMGASPVFAIRETAALSSLSHIFSVGAEANMSGAGPDARRIVTSMQGFEPFWNGADEHFPSDMVRSTVGRYPVSVGILQTEPQPAFSGSIDRVPELRESGFGLPDSLTRCTAVPLRTGAPGAKCIAALDTETVRSLGCRSTTFPGAETTSRVLDVARPHPKSVTAMHARQGNFARHLDGSETGILRLHREDSSPGAGPVGVASASGPFRVKYTTEAH